MGSSLPSPTFRILRPRPTPLPSVSCILDVASGHGNVIGDGYHLIRNMAVVLRLLEVLRELRVACKKIREQWVQWVRKDWGRGERRGFKSANFGG